MSGIAFDAYGDDETVAIVGGLSVENGLLAVVVHGDLVIPRRRDSLADVRALIEVLRGVEEAILRGEADEQPALTADEVENPF